MRIQQRIRMCATLIGKAVPVEVGMVVGAGGMRLRGNA